MMHAGCMMQVIKRKQKISKKMTHLDRKKAYFLFISIVIIQPKEGKNYENESIIILKGGK
jgi:hypothetical protein